MAEEKPLKSSKAAGGEAEVALGLLGAEGKSVNEELLGSGLLDVGKALLTKPLEAVVTGAGAGSKSSRRLTEEFFGLVDVTGIGFVVPEKLRFNEANASNVELPPPFEEVFVGFSFFTFTSREPNGSNDGGFAAEAIAVVVFAVAVELNASNAKEFPVLVAAGAC